MRFGDAGVEGLVGRSGFVVDEEGGGETVAAPATLISPPAQEQKTGQIDRANGSLGKVGGENGTLLC